MVTKLMIVFAGLFIGLASGCGLDSDGPTEVRVDSFVVGALPGVMVTGDNGRIIVNAGPDRTVSVKATLREPDDVEYEITQVGDVINVNAKTDDGGIFNFGESSGVDIEITTPSNTAIELLDIYRAIGCPHQKRCLACSDSPHQVMLVSWG